jgi:hypothetical protein
MDWPSAGAPGDRAAGVSSPRRSTRIVLRLDRSGVIGPSYGVEGPVLCHGSRSTRLDIQGFWLLSLS